jgi:trans-aconitate 2-methyltransferase
VSEWSAAQYLKFEDERTLAARDLLAMVPLTKARVAVDLGCGPGNSTELLTQRYPEAKVSGLDSSPDMLRQAGRRLPGCEFFEADLALWTPRDAVDLIFANAVFQWVPEHPTVMKRLAECLPEGGVLAAQMPDNTREPSHLLLGEEGREHLPSPEEYYDLLKPVCRRVEIRHTIYHHVLAGSDAIVEWFRGSALRPILSKLSPQAAEEFLKTYRAEIAKHYPPTCDGQVLLRFPRLFIVLVR